MPGPFWGEGAGQNATKSNTMRSELCKRFFSFPFSEQAGRGSSPWSRPPNWRRLQTWAGLRLADSRGGCPYMQEGGALAIPGYRLTSR